MKEEIIMTKTPVTALGFNNNWEPEFIRLPRPRTRCERTNISRSKMCELVLPSKANGFKPPVRSVVVRQKGKTRGVRLISYPSLINYLNSCGLVDDKEGPNESI